MRNATSKASRRPEIVSDLRAWMLQPPTHIDLNSACAAALLVVNTRT
jgi:hypothetical protein